MSWGFYGRSTELKQLQSILGRGRWFFARITGRRRIGKTTLVQHALQKDQRQRVFYVQVPDSAPAGVLSATHDAMETFGLPQDRYTKPDSLLALARLVESLVSDGYIVALDEFQYFSRKLIAEFTSHLQASVDRLSSRADATSGGLIVLGSLHAELVALLEDRDAPLYNRTTDQLELKHLDVESVWEILQRHAEPSPERLLFLWTLFEGVPKFYRDAYERDVLDATRKVTLKRLFFESSSPLKSEADNWFLSELRGRYDVILKFVARHPGCSNGDIEAHVREVSPDTAEQVGGYLKVLIERYQMLDRKQPIFAKPGGRRGRYYIRDNFLRSWLAALHSPVSALNFRPESDLVKQADETLSDVEGHALERLVATLYQERSRKGLPGFNLTHRLDGYWDRKETEIDFVAIDSDSKTIRFGSCKRDPARLKGALSNLEGHVWRFLQANPRYQTWNHEFALIAPKLSLAQRKQLAHRDVVLQDLNDLTQGF